MVTNVSRFHVIVFIARYIAHVSETNLGGKYSTPLRMMRLSSLGCFGFTAAKMKKPTAVNDSDLSFVSVGSFRRVS